ncbi:CHAP domain-containing protein [Tenggerimyces flavus]|uniref:CHAP domain-containing protein n=1 Tax=Tenggerimyces flavus TaxID=1708749 RepID=A0ABV7YKR5_9ACTN|nr:CHAP domain-containing protein [Tenggerimyces flavus]MBM7784729.1 hypothetical protein [Tenggerimyces flavus]
MRKLTRTLLAGLSAIAACAAGVLATPVAGDPVAEAATPYDQVTCGDAAARLFQLRGNGKELWYSSISGPAAAKPVVYGWRKVYTFSTTRPALAVAAHATVKGVVKLFVTDRDGGLRVYNFDTAKATIGSTRNLHTGNPAKPGPYDFSRLTSDGRRLYGTKGGQLHLMTGVTTVRRPEKSATVKTIGYPLALWSNAGNDQELLYTDSAGVLRAVDITTKGSGFTAAITTVRGSGWKQAAITSPGGGLLVRDTPTNTWRHLITLPTKATSTPITPHQTISTTHHTPNPPLTTPPDSCAPRTTSNVVSIARAELGTEEGPEADKYLAWAWPSEHTVTTPWCAGFVSWVTNHKAGVTSFKHLAVQQWVIAAREGRSGLRRVTTPRAGDLIAFDWDGNGDFRPGNSHIGIVDRVGANGNIYTLEGNWGSGTASVHRDVHPRNTTYSQFYIRID